MESLVSILVLDDLRKLIKSISFEIFRIKKFKQQIKDFNGFLNGSFDLPIVQSKYKNKVAYIDLVSFKNDVYLSLNVAYTKTGKPKYIESSTKAGVYKRLTKVHSIRTLSGRKFKKIETKQLQTVNIVKIDKLFPKTSDVKLIENAREKFSLRKKILEDWKELF